MVNNITPITPAIGHDVVNTLGQMLKKGSEALLVFCHEMNARAAFRRERCAGIQHIQLCADRIKTISNIPKRTLMRELGFRSEDCRTLSVEEILRLYHNPKTAGYFDGEIAEAINAYLAARQHYCALCQAGRAE